MTVPNIRLRLAPRLPVTVTANDGLTADLSANHLTIGQDWTAFPIATPSELDAAQVLAYDAATEVWRRTSVAAIAAAALGSSTLADAYKARTELASYTPSIAPDVIWIIGNTGRECPPHPFYKALSNPGHDASFSILVNGVATWYEFQGDVLYPEVLGPTTGPDCSATLLKHAAVAAVGKAPSLALMPGKTYNVLAGITYPITVPFNGNNATINAASGVTLGNFPQNTGPGGIERAAVKWVGSLTAIPDLASNVARGAITISFAAAHTLAVGDVFSIHNPTAGSYSAYRGYYTAGEFCEVARVLSSTQVELVRPLYAAYTAAATDCHKLGARAATIQRVKAVAPTALTTVGAINFAFANKGATIDCQGFHGDGDEAIVWDRCYATINDRCEGLCIRPGVSPGTGGAQYGLAFYSCQGMQGNSLIGDGDRHGIAYGGGTRPAGIVNRDCHFKGRFTGRYDLAADWHGNVEFCSYDGDYYGGVNIGGHGNKVTGRVFMAGCGPSSRVAVNFGEPTSFQHEVSLYIDQPNDTWAGTSGTNGYLIYGLFGRIIGAGETTPPYSDKLLYPGVLTLDLVINAPTSRGGIQIFKNGATAAGHAVHLRRVEFVSGVAASGQSIRVEDTTLYAGDTITNRFSQFILGEIDTQVFNSTVTGPTSVPRIGRMPTFFHLATRDLPSMATGTISQWNETVAGVTDGDWADVAAVGDEFGLTFDARTYNGGVQVTARNDQGVTRDLANMTYRIEIKKWM